MSMFRGTPAEIQAQRIFEWGRTDAATRFDRLNGPWRDVAIDLQRAIRSDDAEIDRLYIDSIGGE